MVFADSWPRKFFSEIFASTFFKMVLCKYFKPCGKASCNMPLPDPEGPLSKEMDIGTIKELNKEVESLVNSGTMGKRSLYLKVTAKQKATIGKYVFVPPNCTDMLQLLDLSVNKSAKDYLKSRFQPWYSDQIFEQHNDSTSL